LPATTPDTDVTGKAETAESVEAIIVDGLRQYFRRPPGARKDSLENYL